MAEASRTRRFAALVSLVAALFLGLMSIQGLALAQEAPPSDEEPSSEPPSDEESPPASDGGEDSSPDNSGQDEAPPSDGGEGSSNSGGGSPSSGGEDSSATHKTSSTKSGDANGESIQKKLRKLVASTNGKSAGRGEGKAVANSGGDLGKLVAGGEGLVGGVDSPSNARIPTKPGVTTKAKSSSVLALTGATVFVPLAIGTVLIGLGLGLLMWDRTKRLAIQIAAGLPVL
jgi:cytoskeletal protein RodZ